MQHNRMSKMGGAQMHKGEEDVEKASYSEKGKGVLANTRPGMAKGEDADDVEKGSMSKMYMSEDGKKKQEMEKGSQFGGKQDKTDDDSDEMKREKLDAMGKSLNSTIDLLKSALNMNPKARLRTLMAKGANGQLTIEEADELRKSFPEASSSDAADAVYVSMNENEELLKSMKVDVTGHLQRQHDALTNTLEGLATRLEKSASASEEREFMLAKAMLDITTVVQAQAEQVAELSARLENWGSQPAHTRRSIESAPMRKSMPTQTGGELSRRQVIDGLSDMIKSERYSDDEKDHLHLAATALETNRGLPVDPRLAQMVSNFRVSGMNG